MTEEQHRALDTLSERLAEWDENGEGRFSAVDFAAAARKVLSAFGEEWGDSDSGEKD